MFIFRLECLSASGDETCEAGDLDLIQHMNVDMLKLTRLLNGKIENLFSTKLKTFVCLIEEVQKWKLLKKIHHTELVKSVEKVKKTALENNNQTFSVIRQSGIGWTHILKNLQIYKSVRMLN